MAPDGMASADAALDRLAPGPLLLIRHGALAVALAPRAGGRIAALAFDDVDWLVGYADDNAGAIAWGCFPMLPWAGRIRRGRFRFDGRECRLPPNLGPHAIHGVGFNAPWHVEEHAPESAVLAFRLPEDRRWPHGGHARQSFEAGERSLRMTLTLTAEADAMPATIGWHPWFRKPDHLDFRPDGYYPRDGEGIACLPLAGPPPGPWDDCFVNSAPVLIERGSQRLRLTSSCDHWVVYDERDCTTCVEPQTGPPDAFNLGLARRLEPGQSLSAWLLLEWAEA